jgi:hypothetical protein
MGKLVLAVRKLYEAEREREEKDQELSRELVRI